MKQKLWYPKEFFFWLMGAITTALVVAPFVWDTPNTGWRAVDESSIRLKYHYEDRELVSIIVAVPKGVTVEAVEVGTVDPALINIY